MRTLHSSIRNGRAAGSHALTENDLRRIVADHFGYDPDTVAMTGLAISEAGLVVSGEAPSERETESREPYCGAPGGIEI